MGLYPVRARRAHEDNRLPAGRPRRARAAVRDVASLRCAVSGIGSGSGWCSADSLEPGEAPEAMSPSRREVLIQLAALAALPRAGRRAIAADPLDGTIAEYQAGRRQGQWSAAEITAAALERCRTDGTGWRAIDALTPETALAEARASDARLHADRLLGPLDGVPVFAKSIYDVRGLPTTGSSANWARLFPEPVGRGALEVERLRPAGA
ncbi:MAG: hypothetical protein FIB01_06040, partial [Gemmatimonadetes bacterium]|nr:hypothetical protein [Gemmatimonadota bacterium]